MVKKEFLSEIVLALLILTVGVLLVSCTNEPKTIEAQASTVNEGIAEAVVSPVPSPTLAPPAITVSTDQTAISEQVEPPPDPTAVEIAVTETAASTSSSQVVPATETPIIAHTSVPLPTPSGTYSWTLRVPILMYHYISIPPEDADIYRTDLSVPPENFRQQMAYLAENGYTPIDFYQLSAAITAKTDLPDKPIILTFDDGYLDNYENAFPILKEYGFIGTFFVITDFADQGAQGYANWEQLKEMSAAGMRIESHTKNHPDLTTKGRDGVIFQVLGAQETIAAHIGYTPRYLCYPGGRYTEETMQILKDLDLWGAVTTQGGTWHGFEDRYEWSRQRMRFDTTMEQFILFVNPEGTVGGKSAAEN